MKKIEWNVQQTLNLVQQLFGKSQRVLVNPCVQSAVDRRDYARYHLEEACSNLERHFEDRKEVPVILVVLGFDKAERSELDECLAVIGAHSLQQRARAYRRICRQSCGLLDVVLR